MKKLSINLTDSQYDLLKNHAQRQGLTVDELVLELLGDVFALESDDPYLAVQKRSSQIIDRLELRMNDITTNEIVGISDDTLNSVKIKKKDFSFG